MFTDTFIDPFIDTFTDPFTDPFTDTFTDTFTDSFTAIFTHGVFFVFPSRIRPLGYALPQQCQAVLWVQEAYRGRISPPSLTRPGVARLLSHLP